MREPRLAAAAWPLLLLAACATPIGASLVRPALPTMPLPQLIRSADYPAAALANREQGIVRFRLNIGANGRVTGCTITRSSGSRWLDSATCQLMVRRARFTPARGRSGEPREGRFDDSLTWRL